MKQGTEYSPQGYDPGKGMNEIATKLSLNPYEIVKLDANENMFIPRSFLQQLMIKTAKELDPRFYGIDEKNGLQKRIAAYEEVSFNDILIGAGADQLIDLVIKAFATNGDRVFSLEPTFYMYQACAYSNGIPYKAIPLTKAFALD
ncbi:MAG: aminotransferase class I/II-fold pyridoxal phosphate-dependent enzyme, partial [Candidatus Thorarchaeota archaeon]